jgi:ParB family chromosome partitioning protein
VSSEAFTLEVQQAPAVGTAGDEWGTPQWLIDIARQVLGGIDVDPASNAAAQERVCATRWYSAERSGLAVGVEWRGRVWMNPPYSRDLCWRFARRLLAEIDAGHCEAAAVLVNAAVSARWFQALLARADATCWLAKRVAFLDGAGQPVDGNAFSQALMYFGPDARIFESVLASHGSVTLPDALIHEGVR